MGPVANSRALPADAPLAGNNQQELLPKTSSSLFVVDRSVTIQIFPDLSIAKLSGLANPIPPSQGSPPVATIRQLNLPPGT